MRSSAITYRYWKIKAFPHRIPLSQLKVGPDAVGCGVMQRVKGDLASGSQVTGCPC